MSYKVQCRLNERLIWSCSLTVIRVSAESSADCKLILSDQKGSFAQREREPYINVMACNFPPKQYVDTNVCFIQNESKQFKCIKLSLPFCIFLQTQSLTCKPLWFTSWQGENSHWAVLCSPSFHQKPVKTLMGVPSYFLKSLFIHGAPPFFPETLQNVTPFVLQHVKI